MVPRDLSLGRTFDVVAADYDRFRPRYPEAAFDDLAALASVDERSSILEVGCGPGVATEAMMARGWSVLGVEPGAELARVAREKLAGGRFDVEVATFDDWETRGRRFDLVVSATAYHWVHPEIRWRKAAEVLNEGGHLALLTNENVAEGSYFDFMEATRELRVASGVGTRDDSYSREELTSLVAEASGDIGDLWESLSAQGTEVVAGDLFAAPEVRLYPWSGVYSTREALGLLATYSRYLVMDPVRREDLFERLAHVADVDFAGRLELRYVTVMAVAARTGSAWSDA